MNSDAPATMSLIEAEPSLAWVTKHKHAQCIDDQYVSLLTLEEEKRAIAEVAVKPSEKKNPTLPLLYYRNSETGKWEVSAPQTSNPKMKGQLVAHSKLTIRRMEVKQRLRAKLANKKA